MQDERESEQAVAFWHSYWEARNKRDKSRRISIILRVYAILGMLLFVVGVMYFALSLYQIELTREQTIAVILSGAGLLMTVASLGVSNLWRYRADEYNLEIHNASMRGRLLASWGEFEKVVRSTISNAGLNANGLRLRPLLVELTKLDLIAEEDLPLLKRALDVRNAIAHGADFYSSQEIAELTEYVARITMKLARGTDEDDRGYIE
ncbi:hypothetical protein L905_18985 [Agrobacterium sp. TS43]|uniref:hypothetical protein n=1 Tax=Agrobacterium TaxID=357 RepID=UPI0004A1628A|nr:MULTISPECIES: hypothetical protein [Agrobacterium]KDR87688.1 hypothetical protein K538_06945 [Agrobacterium tumefaciens GW4]KVK49478.1 hypothetical protein L903_19340 [Agrobacterium sp. JL28]KVK49714.1 hypothetical protein L904_19325 [Agrobacterium sp. LY4]KVK62657.1 hypothetical protein L906_18460 [Agrobacterium sp. TS45]KVK65042.1 hypothetical protein L905_18985 [Agrobacterium sp. TS43]